MLPDTTAAALYGRSGRMIEDYYCSYGVNPDYRAALEKGGLRISGLGDEGEVRIVELPGHPFFLATLFLPQMRSTAGRPAPAPRGLRDAVRPAAMTPR